MLNIMMDEFSFAYRVKPMEMTHESLDKTWDLIDDELSELQQEYFGGKPVNKKDAAKEMLDIIYITAQRLRSYGVDVDAGLAEVHRSNMSKTVPLRDAEAALIEARKRYGMAYIEEGQRYVVLRCASTGKVIKPEAHYSPANITDEIMGDK